ncbi:hypothetical protein NN561_019445 [Cricetulus griseus]
MAADPLPPSAMAQPGTLNLNNEVSAAGRGCGVWGSLSASAAPAARAADGIRGSGKAERGRRREPRAAGRVPGRRLRTPPSLRR